jgi:hypothetical protein
MKSSYAKPIVTYKAACPYCKHMYPVQRNWARMSCLVKSCEGHDGFIIDWNGKWEVPVKPRRVIQPSFAFPA